MIRMRSPLLALPFLLLAAACAAGPVQPVSSVSDHASLAESGSISGNYLAGLHGEATGNWRAAANYLSAVAAGAPDNESLREQAFIVALSAGDLPRAETLASQISDKSSQSYFAHLTLAVAAMRDNHAAEAAKHIKAMADNRLGLFTKPLLMAWVEQAQGHPKEAAKMLDKIEGDTDLGALYALHRAYLAQVQNKQGADALIIAAAKPPAPLRAAVAAARATLAKGDVKGARQIMDDFLKLNPESRLAEIERARLSEKPAPGPLVTNPKDGMGEALFNLAGAFQQQEAAQLVQIFGFLSASLRPDDPLIRLMLGDTAGSRQQWDVALNAYEKIPATSPYRMAGLMRAAVVAEAADRQADAIAYLDQAAKADPSQPDPWQQLGDLYRRAEDYRGALAAYQKAAERLGPDRPGQWNFYYSRAIAYFENDDWKQAEADLQKALKLSPDQPYVLNFLAYTWADQGQNLDKAEALLRRALAGEPDDGAIIDSVGWVLFRQGKTQEALRFLEKAVLRLPADPEVNDHLGDVYWSIGRRAEARFQWQRALDEAQKQKEKRLIERIAPKLKDHVD